MRWGVYVAPGPSALVGGFSQLLQIDSTPFSIKTCFIIMTWVPLLPCAHDLQVPNRLAADLYKKDQMMEVERLTFLLDNLCA